MGTRGDVQAEDRALDSHGELDPGCTMTPKQVALHRRIAAFEFDAPGVVFPYSARLARENGWSRAYTARVITEYRRFLFLACAARHLVCPPPDVDQAWHLHLLYTSSYWDGLCRTVLQMPLHHEPTQGGSHERACFFDSYARTRESYRRFFDATPPVDIWPPPEIRFGSDLHVQQVNTRRSWVIRKPWAR